MLLHRSDAYLSLITLATALCQLKRVQIGSHLPPKRKEEK